MYVSVSVIIGSFHWAPSQFTLDEFQCHPREILYPKVHGYSEIAIVWSNLGKSKGIFTTRGDIKILLLHLVGNVLQPLLHVRLKVTLGDDIPLLFPIHFNVFLQTVGNFCQTSAHSCVLKECQIL